MVANAMAERAVSARRLLSHGQDLPECATMNRSSNLPVPVGQPYETPRGQARSATTGKAGAFDAQLIGQDGVKRGLKGGAPVLDAARAAYLGAEYSGEADRRPPAGLLMRSKI
jgi:hypothetical protein